MNKEKERLYFIIEYSKDGRKARRRTNPDPNYYRVQGINYPIELSSFLEIENTQEDVYGLADTEIMKWIDLPEPRF